MIILTCPCWSPAAACHTRAFVWCPATPPQLDSPSRRRCDWITIVDQCKNVCVTETNEIKRRLFGTVATWVACNSIHFFRRTYDSDEAPKNTIAEPLLSNIKNIIFRKYILKVHWLTPTDPCDRARASWCPPPGSRTTARTWAAQRKCSRSPTRRSPEMESHSSTCIYNRHLPSMAVSLVSYVSRCECILSISHYSSRYLETDEIPWCSAWCRVAARARDTRMWRQPENM